MSCNHVLIGIIAAACLLGAGAQAQSGSVTAESPESAFADSPIVPAEPARGSALVSGDRAGSSAARRMPLRDVPNAVPNPDPRVEESLTISTEALHGFSSSDVERAAAERIAQITGTPAEESQHPSVAGYGRYTIGAGDILEFLSFDDETLSREVTVRYDGYISLPRVRDIKVAGLTRQEAEESIREAYGAIYREPELSLTILTPDSKTYVVTGDVEDPGRYAYTRETSLWDAITLAGGLRDRGDTGTGGGFVGLTGQITKALVIRRLEGERKVYTYDMRGLGEPGRYEGDVPIYYGDIVYVPEGVNLVYVLGETLSPITVELTQGMTLLQMLALSGGFNPSTARLREVVLLREVDDTNTDVHLVDIRAILKGKQEDIRLVPGDVVYIPRKRILRLQEFVTRFTGSLSPLMGLYTQAIDTIFAYDIANETLDALERANSTSVGARGVTTLPRTLGTGDAPSP